MIVGYRIEALTGIAGLPTMGCCTVAKDPAGHMLSGDCREITNHIGTVKTARLVGNKGVPCYLFIEIGQADQPDHDYSHPLHYNLIVLF